MWFIKPLKINKILITNIMFLLISINNNKLKVKIANIFIIKKKFKILLMIKLFIEKIELVIGLK